MGEVNHAHTGAIADVPAAPFHGGGQIVKMILNEIRLIIRNCTRIDLSQKKTPIRRQFNTRTKHLPSPEGTEVPVQHWTAAGLGSSEPLAMR